VLSVTDKFAIWYNVQYGDDSFKKHCKLD